MVLVDSCERCRERALVCTTTSGKFPTVEGRAWIGGRTRRPAQSRTGHEAWTCRLPLDRHLRIATPSANSPSILHDPRRHDHRSPRIRPASRPSAPGTLACPRQPTSISVSKLFPGPSLTHVLALSWTTLSLESRCSGVSAVMPTSPQSTRFSRSRMSRLTSCSTRAT
jgi:hypothetical protein